MNPSILCTWLGLKEKSWPPDPYALLGIGPEEKDVARIEQKVHERLTQIRGYQISHPEEATEGMNRLAQAFIHITDGLSRPECKKPAPVITAVATLPRNGKIAPPAQEKIQVSKEDTAVGLKTQVDWQNTPPPVRQPLGPQQEETPLPPPEEAAQENPAVQVPPPPDSPPDPVAAPTEPAAPLPDIALELAHHSDEAREGLGSLKGLRRRITQTRKLSVAWKQVGKYIRNPRRRPTRPAAEADLTRRMDYLFELMEDYPAFLGHPGKPGYRVVGMARLEMTAQMFKALDIGQREELAKDWSAGEKVLREHRRFLLKRLKSMKRRNRLDKALSATEDFLRKHFLWVLLTLLILGAAGLYFLFR